MGEGVCRLNICYKVAAFVIPFNVICNNMTMLMIFLFCLFDPTNRVGGGGGRGGVCGQNNCYHAAAFMIPFNLICNVTMF